MHSVPRKAEEATASFTPSYETVSASNLGATTNIIFGVFAIIFAAATLWQGHKLWRNLRQHPPPNPTEATVEEQELDSIPTTPSIVVAADEPTISAVDSTGEGERESTVDAGRME